MDLLDVVPLLDGEDLTDGGGGAFDVVNPATDEIIASESCCDEAGVARIVLPRAEMMLGYDDNALVGWGL